jgi:hypothetical protein
MTRNVVKVLESADGLHRVLIIKRDDGAYSLHVERRYRNVYEGHVIAEGWQAMGSRGTLFASADIAEREARWEHAQLKLIDG